MQNYWEMISKKNYEVSNYWDMFCRNTEKCSGKIPIRGLRQYWKVFSKNTERCPIEILRCVRQKCWKVLFKISEGSFTFWHTINNIHVKTQGLGLFPFILWPSILGGQKIISNYSVRMRKNTDQKKLHIWTLFT